MEGMKCICWFIRGIHIDSMVVQGNGAPVWLVQAAFCEESVLQWLADKGIKPPAVDSYVWHFDELGLIRV
jgi:hypothetical protein